MDKAKESSRLGALFGQGIGDALGIRDEFRCASEISKSGRDRMVYTTSSRTTPDS